MEIYNRHIYINKLRNNSKREYYALYMYVQYIQISIGGKKANQSGLIYLSQYLAFAGFF